MIPRESTCATRRSSCRAISRASRCVGRASRSAGPSNGYEAAGMAKLKADPAHDVYSITAEQTAEWKKSSEFLYKKWADDVRKVGGDADTIIKELQTLLVQYKAGV